jgi:hypothetical protein
MSRPAGRPRLQVVDAGASPEEVAAIVAAVTAALGAGSVAGPETEAAVLSPWVQAARLRARRTGTARGSWRLSGRVGGRSGA